MKPVPFHYFRPSSLEEAISILKRYDGEAKLLAGGQSLIPLLNMRLARPSALVDLSGIPGLDDIKLEGQDLIIGAMVRHSSVERSPLVAERCPLLREAMSYVGHPAIRTRGTFGGSMAHADPAAELPAVAALVDASFHIIGPVGWRTVPWQDFFETYLTNCLEPTEILVEVRLPLPARSMGSAFLEVARRHGDFALVGAAALVDLDEAGCMSEVRLALMGVGGTPWRLTEVEKSLLGHKPQIKLYQDAGDRAAVDIEPESDVHASADYRRDLTAVLVERVLMAAASRASKTGRGEVKV
ncbi:MAG: FAD binding domain-containing protein [Ktedonobacteraceae bacterium]